MAVYGEFSKISCRGFKEGPGFVRTNKVQGYKRANFKIQCPLMDENCGPSMLLPQTIKSVPDT